MVVLAVTWMAKAGRESKILLDYLRNNRTATAIESFSDDSVLAELAGAFAVARRASRRRTEEARALALLGEEPSR